MQKKTIIALVIMWIGMSLVSYSLQEFNYLLECIGMSSGVSLLLLAVVLTVE